MIHSLKKIKLKTELTDNPTYHNVLKKRSLNRK